LTNQYIVVRINEKKNTLLSLHANWSTDNKTRNKTKQKWYFYFKYFSAH